MFYFDFQNPIHVAFLLFVVAMVSVCVALLSYNRARRIPVVLPQREPVGIEADSVAPTPESAELNRDLVEIFVIAPEIAPPESMFRIFVNINNYSPDAGVTRLPGDWEALIASLQAGDAVGLIMQCSQLQIDTPYQALSWDRRNHVAVFNVRAPAVETSADSDNKLLVVVGGFPIGEIDFKIRIAGQRGKDVATRRQNAKLTINNVSNEVRNLPIAERGFRATRFKSAFISYARANTKEMALFCSGLDARGIDIKVDQFEFRSGETWDDQAKELIDVCDIVFLLWSAEAAGSDAVRKEIDHAVERRTATGKPRLHPVVVKPSDDLPAPPHVPSNLLWAGRFAGLLK